MARLKERLSIKKFSNLKQPRERRNVQNQINNTTQPSRTYDLVSETDEILPDAGKRGVKIDSGLVNLKNSNSEAKDLNMHKFVKRVSVNFPVNLKHGNGPDDPSALESLESDKVISSDISFSNLKGTRGAVTERTSVMPSPSPVKFWSW